MMVTATAGQSPGRSVGQGVDLANVAGGLRVSWIVPDHPSALFHVKSTADAMIFMDNPSRATANPGGEILFGKLEPVAGQFQPRFSPLSVTPIAAAALASGQRVRIPVPVTFAGAGAYQFRWKHDNVEEPIACSSEGSAAPATQMTLQCIFAPRPAQDSPWLAPLPPAAVRTPGYLADFIRQTTVRRFLIDERFAFDSASGVGLGFGASLGMGSGAEGHAGGLLSLSAAQIDAFLAEAARAKASLALRLSVPLAAPDPRTLAAFRKYISDAVGRSKGTLNAIAITPESPPAEEPSAAQRGAFQTYYLAAYAAAKRADRNIALLGAGSAQMTDLFLGEELRPYLDVVAASDAAGDAGVAEAYLARGAPGNRRVPLWILPPHSIEFANPIPPAAALARNAAVVPVPQPEADHGVTAHLLNGTVFIQRIFLATLSPDAPSPLPFIALFQGDGYSLAAIAGPSAGTELDAAVPGLARGRTQLEPAGADEKPRYANLEVSDDTHSMRVVDRQGEAVECRFGDSIFVPTGDKVFYLLQAGRADDLAGSLRPARANHQPLFEISASLAPNSPMLSVDVQNVAASELSARVRVILPTRDNAAAASLGEKELTGLAPGKHVALSFEMAGEQSAQARAGPLVVEVTTPGGPGRPVIQRTALKLTSPTRPD